MLYPVVLLFCAGNLLSKNFGKLGLRPNSNCDGLNLLLFIRVYFAQTTHERAVSKSQPTSSLIFINIVVNV